MRFIRKPEVKRLTGLSDTAIQIGEKAGTFPQSIPITENGGSVAWVEEEIEQWMENRVKLARAGKLKRVQYRPHVPTPGKRGPGRPRKNPLPEEETV
jgi:prophage regulatory protein